MAKFCISCGNEIPEGNSVCASCGTPVDGAPKAVAPAPAAPSQSGTTVVVNQTQPAKPTNGLAIAGFVISLLCCGSLSPVSLILSIIGLIKAKDINGSGKGLAIAGIILSALGIILLIFWLIFGTAFFAGVAEAIEEETAAGYGY